MNFLASIGRATLTVLAHIGRLAQFTGQALAAKISPPIYTRLILGQMMRIGYYSLPVVGLTAFFTGGVLALQIYLGGNRFGAEATIRLRVSADQLTIDVEDDGPVISDAQKQNVLEPFVRGDDARNMDEAAGFGLGLSIANAIVLAHGGTLSLHDRQPHGLVVRMQLPVRQESLAA